MAIKQTDILLKNSALKTKYTIFSAISFIPEYHPSVKYNIFKTIINLVFLKSDFDRRYNSSL